NPSEPSELLASAQLAEQANWLSSLSLLIDICDYYSRPKLYLILSLSKTEPTMYGLEPHHGIMFALDIPILEREGIARLLCERDDLGSPVDQFAFGRSGRRLSVYATGTAVHVTKGWHQTSSPHLTVQLREIYGGTGISIRVGTAHIYKDLSETIDWVGFGPKRLYRVWGVEKFLRFDKRDSNPNIPLRPTGSIPVYDPEWACYSRAFNCPF
ncbi:hypothetical protein TUN205_07793, partial [Pyrenophora tritici-repentis]